MKLLSDATEYGLRAVVWLSRRPGESHKTRQIAEGTHAAPGYLIKVLQSLTRAGILSAQRGSHGGFTLVRDPAVLTVLEVINAVDPFERINSCPLGLAAHGEQLCPVHQKVDDAMAQIEQAFASSTIADLLSQPTSSHPLCAALTVEGEDAATPEEK
jgi:Rrf2 family protein